jgi:hypothetical protein
MPVIAIEWYAQYALVWLYWLIFSPDAATTDIYIYIPAPLPDIWAA